MNKGKANEFKKFLLLKLTSSLNYDRSLNSFTLGQKNASAKVKKEIRQIGTGKDYEYTEAEIAQHIAAVVNDNAVLKSSAESVTAVNPQNLAEGEVCMIKHTSRGGEVHTEELLKISKKDFLIIDHTLGSLACGGVLTSSNEWVTGKKARFDVKNNPDKIYETGSISELEILRPNEVYEIMNNKYARSVEKYYSFRFDIRNNAFNPAFFTLDTDKKSWIELNITGNQGYFKVTSDRPDLTQLLTSREKTQLAAISEPVSDIRQPDYSTSQQIATVKEGTVNRIDGVWRVTEKAKIKID